MEKPNLQELQENKETSFIPDLREFMDYIAKLDLPTGLLAFKADKKYPFSELEEKIVKTMNEPDPGCHSAIKSLYAVLNWYKETNKKIGELARGGSMCEIGGPTHSVSKRDIIYAGVQKYVGVNTGTANVEAPMERGELTFTLEQKELANSQLQIKAYFDKAAENLEDIALTEGRFDFITAYHVFGRESIDASLVGLPHDLRYGADLSTKEKRMNVLNNLAAALKRNGVVLFENFRQVTAFSLSEIEAAGFSTVVQENEPAKGQEKSLKPLVGSIFMLQYLGK